MISSVVRNISINKYGRCVVKVWCYRVGFEWLFSLSFDGYGSVFI